MSRVRLVPDELIEQAAICCDACVRKWPVPDLPAMRRDCPLWGFNQKRAVDWPGGCFL